MKRSLPCLALTVLLTACGGYAWHRPGVTAQQFAADQDACSRSADAYVRHLAALAFSGRVEFGSADQSWLETRGEQHYRQCMQACGYELRRDERRS